jgi:hypothetical protein
MAFPDDNEIGEIPAIDFTEVDGVTYLEPSTPASGQLKLFPKDDHLLYIKDSTGTVTVLDTGTSGAPSDATYITQTPNGTLTNEQALSALATGILKSTTTTGILSIATAGTDYLTPSPASSSIDVISATTATVRALALKTTDDNTTNNLLEFLSSTSVVLASVSPVGGATLPTAYIGATGGPVATELTVVTTSASDPRGIMSAQYSTDTNASRVHLRKARGTPAVPTTIVTGDVLGRVRFSGYDGSNFLQMASIDAISTGTVAATRIPTYLSFSVATDAAPSVLTEVARLTITGLNNTTIGATTPAAATFTTSTTSTWFALTSTSVAHAAVSPGAGNAASTVLYQPTDFSSVFSGMDMYVNPTGTGSSITSSFRSLNLITQVDGTGGGTSGPIGIVGEARVNQTSGTWSAATAASFAVRNINANTLGTAHGVRMIFIASSTGNTTLANLFDARPPSMSSTGTLATLQAYYAENQGNSLITTSIAFHADTQTGSTNNIYMLLGTTSPSGNWAIHATTTSDSALAGKLKLGATTAPGTTLDVLTSDAVTAAVTNVVTIGHDSSGTPAANYGTGTAIQGKSSTTAGQSMGDIQWIWTTPTHASRKARGTLTAYDTTVRTCIQWEASGTAPMIGFLGTAPVVQATAWTQTYSTSSHTTANPTATSVVTTGAALASYGYTQAQADDIVTELNRLITDVANAKNNINAIIDDLQTYGLFG